MEFGRLFCIIDPTTQHQQSLDRAALIAQRNRTSVHAFLCFSPAPIVPSFDEAEYHRAERQRHELWLNHLVFPLRQAGAEVTTEVVCTDDWRRTLASAVGATDADLVIKSTRPHSRLQRRFMTTSDWLVLRDARCPVVFAKQRSVAAVKTVLAAVNLGAKDDAHQRLTDSVIAAASEIATAIDAEMHAVNAYSSSRNRVHPPDLAKRAGIVRSRAHVGDATPEELIAEIASRVAADLVVIGSVGRKGLTGAVVGNTAERILDTVDADVLVLVEPA